MDRRVANAEHFVEAPMPQNTGTYIDQLTAWIYGSLVEIGIRISSLGTSGQDLRDLVTQELGSIRERLKTLEGFIQPLNTKLDNLTNLITNKFGQGEPNPSAVPDRVKVWYKSSFVVITTAVLVGAVTANLLYEIVAGVTAEVAYQLGISSEGYFNEKQVAAVQQGTTTETSDREEKNAKSSLDEGDINYLKLRQEQRQAREAREAHKDNYEI